MDQDSPDGSSSSHLPATQPETVAEPGVRRRDDSLRRGDSLGRYLVLDRLGAGGMGVVYTAYDPALDRRIALKLLRSERLERQQERDRFRREALALARLAHPHVVTVYDVGSEGPLLFLATELVEGSTLGEWLEEEARAWTDVLEVFAQAGRGLEAAHAAGLVHRDFKPSNVVLGRDGRIRVMDFGLARAVGATSEEPAPAPSEMDSHAPGSPGADPATGSGSSSVLSTPVTQLGSVLGTPGYMAPEQYRGEEADARTDQFAFCVALYEALFREAPFSADHPAARLQTLDDRPRLPTDDRAVPREVREAIVRGLSPRREDRFDSMDDLLRALDHGRYAPRRKRLAVATVATAVLVALVAWWAVRPRPALPTGGRVLVLPIAGDAETSPGIAGGLAELVGSSLDELPGVDVVTPGAELAELRQEASEGPEEAGGFGRDALDRLRRAYGADLVLAARIHEAEALFTVQYAVAGDDPAWRERSVRAGDPVTAVNEMAARVGLLLAPEANRVDLRRIFSEDPFVNRLYATGVAQLMRGGPSVAADYFRVALDQDPSFHWARLRLAEARHLEGGDPAEAEALLDEVQAAAEASRDARLLAATLHERGSQALDRGRLEAAAAPLHRALELHRQLGETTQVIEDLLALGLLGYRAEELEEAERWWREAAELAATDEQELATAKATNNLALLLMEQDRLDEAGEHFERAATTFRRLGMRQGLATVLGNLGQVAGDQGRLDDARRALDEELALQEALGNRKEVLVNLVNQAWLASLSGHCGGIRDVVERGSELARQQDTPLLEANLLIHDYLCATITGQGLERQEAQLRHALEIAVASEVPGMDHGLQVALAEYLVRGGRVGEARAFLLDVEAAGPEVTGDPGLAPYVAGVRGRLALAEGRTADAVPFLEAAVRDLPIPRSEDREILERARRELGENADQPPPRR